MNERIKELIPRPWTFPYPDREMYSREQMEHLAELIVRECVERIQTVGVLEHMASTGDMFADAVLEHFGVE
jgi:hypothetical protein